MGRRLFLCLLGLGVWLVSCLVGSAFGQVPMEGSVSLSVSYLPRSSAKAGGVTLNAAGLIREMGLSGGGIVCVGDGSDPSVPWIFKHVLPAVRGGGPRVETDLSDRIGFQVLGFSDVVAYKEPLKVAPRKPFVLGKVTRTQTVRISIEPREGMFFEFWGSMVIGYSVVQQAGSTRGVWVPGSMSFTAVGTHERGGNGGALESASLKATMSAFRASEIPGWDSTTRGLLAVTGGALPVESGLGGKSVKDFWIGRYEVMWAEWKWIRDWSRDHGYDLGGVGSGSGEDHPVHSVSWYDVIKWCNARSEREGLTPVYHDENGVFRSGEYGYASQFVLMDAAANGYRLPLETEWEWAARGGVKSSGYTYSGGNNPSDVGWFFTNSVGTSIPIYQGRGTWPVGRKRSNELLLNDMSGNVSEWVWDVTDDTFGRRFRGGSWSFPAESAELSRRGDGEGPDIQEDHRGFRVARNGPNGL